MRVSFVRDPSAAFAAAAWPDLAAELLMALVGIFMAIWGYRLCVDTWNNRSPSSRPLSVGVTYLPIPLGGGGLDLT